MTPKMIGVALIAALIMGTIEPLPRGRPHQDTKMLKGSHRSWYSRKQGAHAYLKGIGPITASIRITQSSPYFTFIAL